MESDSTLPKQRSVAKARSRLKAKAPVLLFVEDNYDWSYLFREEFKKIAPDWEIMSTCEGWAAMQQLTKGLVPQALVVDVDMTGVGCRDLIEWVREQPRFHSLPIVALSNSDDPPYRQHCAALGVSSYLEKPGSLKEFQDNIRYIVKLGDQSRELESMSCL